MSQLIIKEEMPLDSVPLMMIVDILANEERAGKWIRDLKIDFDSQSTKELAYHWLQSEKNLSLSGMSEEETLETFIVVFCYHVMSLKRGVFKGASIKLR